MRIKTSHLALLVLLAVATLVAARTQEDQPPSEGTGLAPSNCYKCHGAFSGVSLASVYNISVTSTPMVLDAPVNVTVAVRNDWLAQLRDLSARLDLTGAPEVGFSGKPPPVLGVTSRGNLTFNATRPLALTEERVARVAIALPAGATALRIRLVPDTQTGDAAPDLAFRLWAPATDTKGDATVAVDEAGKGGSETLRVPAATPLLRSGTWLIEAAQAACVQAPDSACLQAQGFRVVGDAWFNVTGGERRQTLPFPVDQLEGQDTDGPLTSQVSWTVFLRDLPQGNQTLRVTVNATAHHDHHPNSARYDDWPYTDSLDLPVRVGGSIAVTAGPAPSTATTSSLPTSVDWGELVGYAGGVALVGSVLSGGAFGQVSRRWLDRVFRGAARRVAVHKLLSACVILSAFAHTALFLGEPTYDWSVGVLWGGPAILLLFLLGVTGALRRRMVRWWGTGAWQALHAGMTYLALLFAVVHLGLDGADFQWIPERLHWQDPLRAYQSQSAEP